MHADRLFPSDPTQRDIARRLYAGVRDLPIISPHGHTQASWFTQNRPFSDPAKLFVQPDHYVFRMLYSQGVSLDDLEIPPANGIGREKTDAELKDPRKIWRIFAENYYLFRGTPTRIWLDYAFESLFGLEQRLCAKTADLYFDVISEKLLEPEFLPRALYERFKIEVLATTDSPLDCLDDHRTLRASGWNCRIVPTFRPDNVVDPENPSFRENLAALGRSTAEDTTTWKGYLRALEISRANFKAVGATATDHGHASAQTADLSEADSAKLFDRIHQGTTNAKDAELFRAQMLTEMARMSIEDGLVMQIHPGSVRDHNLKLFQRYGRDVGADIPGPTNYVHALKPLLDRFGNERGLTLILFTLDESTYSRELAPLAGHYPCLRLGPPWWFHDSPEGMLRFREKVTETAGFYNTVGFNDDTRAFFSIPARHDMARRMDCVYLARLVAEHRLEEDEAHEVARDLSYALVKKAYKL